MIIKSMTVLPSKEAAGRLMTRVNTRQLKAQASWVQERCGC